MPFQTGNFGVRMTYQATADAMANAGIKAQRAKMTQSYLRSEIPLKTTTNQYSIPILVNNNPYGNPNTTERRLQLQDAFVVGSFGIYLAVPASAAAYAAGAFPLLTYPSLSGPFTAAELTAMWSLYNGNMSLMVGQNTLIVAWELSQHYKVNQTQAGVIVTAQTILPNDESDLTTDGQAPQEPNVVHVGSTNIVMNLNLPAAISALPAGLTTYVVVIQRGVLCQNVTSVTNS
jgi:hypothetical protein